MRLTDRLFDPDYRKSIAERENYFFQSRVLCHLVVESTQSDGLFVFVVGGVNDMSIPQGVVG